MRDQPFVIGRIPGKASPKLVEDTPGDHFVQAETCLAKRIGIFCIIIIVEQIADREGLGEFGGAAKTSFAAIGRRQQLIADLPENLGREKRGDLRKVSRRRATARRPGPKRSRDRHMPGQISRLFFDLRPALPV